jgi:hypothetical protein
VTDARVLRAFAGTFVSSTDTCFAAAHAESM